MCYLCLALQPMLASRYTIGILLGIGAKADKTHVKFNYYPIYDYETPTIKCIS